MYVDCNSFGPRAIEAAVSLYGAERIVCGTDGSAFGVDWTRKALEDAAIGEEARECGGDDGSGGEGRGAGDGRRIAPGAAAVPRISRCRTRRQSS